MYSESQLSHKQPSVRHSSSDSRTDHSLSRKSSKSHHGPYGSRKTYYTYRRIRSGRTSSSRYISSTPPEECAALNRRLQLENRRLKRSLSPLPGIDRKITAKGRKKQESGIVVQDEFAFEDESFVHEGISDGGSNFLLPLPTPKSLRSPRYKQSLPTVYEEDEEEKETR